MKRKTFKKFKFAARCADKISAGTFTGTQPLSVKYATEMVAWRIQKEAIDQGWEFDFANFEIAVQPVWDNGV